jgi:hypothetical protein
MRMGGGFMQGWHLAACLVVASVLPACGEDECKCKTPYEYSWRALIPGPAEEGHDAGLAEVAARRDRQYHVFHVLPTGVNAEIGISPDKTAERQAIEDFLNHGDGWDFEAASSYRVLDVVDSWWKVAGMYGGAGLAADAFRYGVMRDQCYPQEEVDRARQQLLRGLDSLHMAFAITGMDGIARGFSNRTYPGGDNPATPLFDGQGNPLPEEKSNGTWRGDNSGGRYPDFVWEDSCSRDMLIGWMVGMGAAWEVIEDDKSISGEVKDTMRDDARGLAGNLRTVRENGYDLELEDADGRTTYHGYLNENNLDRIYADGIRNGFHTIMALGVIGVLAAVAGDPGIDSYLYDELIADREFAVIAKEDMLIVNLEEVTNFSNYNMAFDGAWLALRFIEGDGVRADLREALEKQLYDTPGKRFQPLEQKQSFFDLVYAAGMCDSSADSPCRTDPDQSAVDRALQTLEEFPKPPFFEFERINCDDTEIQSGQCLAEDGTPLTVLGTVGRNGDLITAEPLPMRIRPPSNYYWRSNPYMPNGGSAGSGMYAGPDFRLAYWMGRFIRRP